MNVRYPGRGIPESRFNRIEGVAALSADGPLPLDVRVSADDRTFTMRVRIDTPFERQVFRAGGILAATLRAMLS